MTRFIVGFLAGAAAAYLYGLFQLATPETETIGNGSESWPLFI